MFYNTCLNHFALLNVSAVPTSMDMDVSNTTGGEEEGASVVEGRALITWHCSCGLATPRHMKLNSLDTRKTWHLENGITQPDIKEPTMSLPLNLLNLFKCSARKPHFFSTYLYACERGGLCTVVVCLMGMVLSGCLL